MTKIIKINPANIDTDLTITQNGNNGYIKANNLSIVHLPPSNIDLIFKGNKIDIDSLIYTAQNEASTLKGVVQTGKKTNIDLNLKSGVELNNIIKNIFSIYISYRSYFLSRII